jgi:hypothetical protein
MATRNGDPKERKQIKPIAAKVDRALWDEVKIQAIRERRKVGEILDDAIRFYLRTKSRD